MGKKRNNATKKKQAAKKNKLSSAFGVSVQKGGTISRNNGVLDNSSMADASAEAKKHKASIGDGNTKIISLTNHNNGTDGNSSTLGNSGKKSRNGNNENDEFNRLNASLQERSLALQARKDDLCRSKKERQKHQKKGWGKFARPTKNSLAPATLNLGPKSTQELVDDAANKVAQGMNEIGQQHPVTNSIPSYSTAAFIPGQSSLASAAGSNWKMQVSNVQNTTQQSKNENNPFATLDWESDNDMDGDGPKPSASVQQFQFKPASFAFQSNFINLPAVAPGVGNDIDDDDL